jgi:hypothetical protein
LLLARCRIAGSPFGGIILVNPIRSGPAVAAGGNGDPFR